MRRNVALALIGSAIVVAAVFGVLGRSSQHISAVASAEADGGPQVPADYLRGKALGGRKTVSRAQIARAVKQSRAIATTGGTWEYVGANNIGGRVTDVVVDPTHPDTLFISSAGGGVWKSTDAGLTYTPAWPNDYPQAIGSLARGSDGTLWAGTGEANASGGGITYTGDGVYKSTDGGVTWTNVGLENSRNDRPDRRRPDEPGHRLRRRDGRPLLARRQARPLPHGRRRRHWPPVLLPDPNVSPWTGVVDVAIDPVNPNRVYATEWDHHRNAYLRPYGGVGSGLYVTDNADETPVRT